MQKALREPLAICVNRLVEKRGDAAGLPWTPPPGSATPPRTAWRPAVLRIGVSAGFLALLFFLIPVDEVGRVILRLRPTDWVLALTTYLCLHAIGAVKWRLLVNCAGAGLRQRSATRAYYLGLFGNTFLPTIVGGDVLRAGSVYKIAESRAGLLLGSLLDRLLDFSGLLLIATIGAFLAPRVLDARSTQILILAGSTLGGVSVCAALLIWRLPVRRVRYSIRRRFVRVRQAMSAIWSRPRTVLAAFTLGLCLQSSLIILNYWLGTRAGLIAPMHAWFFVWPLAKLSGVAPTQNGIGVREAAQVLLFAPFGVPAEQALGVSLAFEVVIIGGGLIAGLTVFLMSQGNRLPFGSSAK